MINVSGVSRLRQSINLERTKQIDKTITEANENENEENFEDENENVEHFEEQNSHADSTANDLEILKLSAINQTVSTGGRLTRSAKAFLEKSTKSGLVAAVSNKRSRSPLVSNNSMNETIDQNAVLTSTRIEPNRKTAKISIGCTTIGVNLDEDFDSIQLSKRKKRDEDNEMENEINENTNNLIQV